jgi:hypothetical protein
MRIVASIVWAIGGFAFLIHAGNTIDGDTAFKIAVCFAIAAALDDLAKLRGKGKDS